MMGGDGLGTGIDASLLQFVRAKVAPITIDGLLNEGEFVGERKRFVDTGIDQFAATLETGKAGGKGTVCPTRGKGIRFAEAFVISTTEARHHVIVERFSLFGSSQEGIVTLGAYKYLLTSETYIVVEEGIGSTTRLEHIVIAIVESQPADDDVPILVMIAIEAFGRARFVTPKCYTVVGIVYAHRTASCAIASELDAIAIAGEIGTLVEILIYPRVVFGIA